MNKVKLIITGILCFFISYATLAQGPPEPPDSHGGNQDQGPGGNAPIASGTILLVGMAAIYGTKRLMDYRQKNQNL